MIWNKIKETIKSTTKETIDKTKNINLKDLNIKDSIFTVGRFIDQKWTAAEDWCDAPIRERIEREMREEKR